MLVILELIQYAGAGVAYFHNAEAATSGQSTRRYRKQSLDAKLCSVKGVYKPIDPLAASSTPMARVTTVNARSVYVHLISIKCTCVLYVRVNAPRPPPL